MNDEDRSLLSRALDKLSGANSDPVREGLQQLVTEHGRESVAKAATDLGLEPELSDEELAAIEAIAQEGETTSGSDTPDPVEERLAKIEETLQKLAGGETPEASESQELPEDELALVKSGVPVETIEAARPMLRSQDDQARRAAFDLLAKQADPGRRDLLAKERGSSDITDGEKATVEDYKARLAKANGEDGERRPAVEAALEILRRAG